VGFFSLAVGTIVMLRRPPDRSTLHFYAICLLFFLTYSTSYTGRFNLADWTLLVADSLAVLLLPVVFTVMFLSMPSGLVIYWLTSNLLTVGQQYVTNRIVAGPARLVKAK